MPPSPAARWSVDAALLLTRLSIGAYLGLAGVSKAARELGDGFGTFHRGAFTRLSPEWLPDLLGLPYGYALPWLEILVGVALILGVLGRYAAAATGLMIASFTVALIAEFGLKAEPEAARHPFNANYIQVAACALLTALGPGRLSIDGLLLRRAN